MKERVTLMTGKTWRGLALLVLAPLSLWGQTASSGSAAAQPAAPSAQPSFYDNAGLAAPWPAGLASERNLLSFGADFSTGYDDNITQSNADQVADTGLTISPRLALSRDDGRLAMHLNYRPTFRIYSHESSYNEHDDNLVFDAGFRATDRLVFRAETNVLRRSGLFDSLAGTVPAEPGPAVALNNTIVTPFAGQFENDSRAEIGYAASPRSAASAFATYMLRSFAKTSASSVPLFETEGESFGLRYLYRASSRDRLGLTYLYEDIHTGAGTRLNLNAATVALTLAVTPRLQANVFAGPTHADNESPLLLTLGSLGTLTLPVERSGWHWTAGGGITFATSTASFALAGTRQVADGGGLLGAVTNEVVDGSFERRFSRNWTLECLAGWERNTELASGAEPGRLDGEYERIVILHPVSRFLAAGAGYQFQRQRAAGPVPPGATFDRNYVYFTIQYRWKEIRLGR